jgi:type IV secretory pathway VirB10-like protein
MTYQNDPDFDARNRRLDADRAGFNWPIWIAGGAALMLLVGFLAWGLNTNTNVATNERAPVSETRSTTGSGTTSPLPNNPNGTTPQKDMTKPAPAPAPATR